MRNINFIDNRFQDDYIVASTDCAYQLYQSMTPEAKFEIRDTVSLESMKIVKGLPGLEERK